jgi:competence protein ComGC
LKLRKNSEGELLMDKTGDKKKHKKSTTVVIIFINILAVAFFLMIILPVYTSAKTLGAEAGVATGKLVGAAIGSFNGVTVEYQKGLDEGKVEGLSAKDTKVEMQNTMNEVSRLEVLVTNFKVNNYHEVGDKYAALYFLKAEATFTVDLSECDVSMSEDNTTLIVTLPQPEVTVYFDDSCIEKAKEYQKYFFSGSAEDGFDAYINSMANLEKETQKSLQKDENMMQTAKNSAENQIKELATGVCMNGEKIEIIWEK